MSVVYRVHDRVLNQEVALKLLKTSEDETRTLLFLQQEFRAMARLRHPRLVQVYDYGVLDNGSPYFTMELLPGEDLSTLGSLPINEIVQVLLSIADVLGFMHARGYVHRDVKPSNVRVVVREQGKPLEVKLMDCGLTEQLGKKDNAVSGTLAYLAPEAWLGGPADVRGDLYALGVLAYEITTGQLPFDVSTGARLLRAKTERSRDLREVRPEVPAEFACLVRDLLAPEPANRPVSAMAVFARLCELANLEFLPDSTVYLRTPALVGRTNELAALRTAISEALSGRLVPTVILGPPGFGKTRLLDEALIETGVRGAVITRTTGRGIASGPYEALRDLVTPLLHLPAAATTLARIGGKSALGLGRAGASDECAERHLDPITANRAHHLSLAALLDGISRHRTIVLAVDDIHSADAASIDALASLVGAGTNGNIAIVATARITEPLSHSLKGFLALSHRLELGRMAREQISDLIAGVLGPVSPSPTLVADVERASSGNVCFVLEILRDLAARGVIERKRTRITLPDSLDAAGLPTSLAEALERRVAQLSAEALELAQLGAVFARPIDLELLRTVVGKPDEVFLDSLDELRREELINVEDGKMRIHHPRLREVLYQGLTLPERACLHRRAALAIQQTWDDERDLAAELGMHFAEAGDARQALEYLVKAGDAGYQRFAYADAQATYLRAFELVEAAPKRRRRELQRKLSDRLGRICFYHDHSNGPKYLEQACQHHFRYGLLWAVAPLSRVMGSRAALSLCVLTTAAMNTLRLRPRPLESTLSRLVDCFAATTYLANCYTYSGRLQLGLDTSERLVPFVNSRRRIPQVGYLMARVYALVLMNRFDEAAVGCEEALWILKHDRSSMVPEHDRIHATGGALITRLWVDLTRGYCERSRWWTPFEQFVHEHPTALLESWLMEIRVYAAFRQGRVPEMESAWSQFLEQATQAEVAFVQNKARVWVGQTYLLAGRTSEAQDTADEVVRVARSLDNPMHLAQGLHLRGIVLHAWERMDEAEESLYEAERVATHRDVACHELAHSIWLSLATIAIDRQQIDRAEQFARRVLDANAQLELAHDLHCSCAERILGQAALAQNQTEAAIQFLEKSLLSASRTDDSIEQARVLHYLGKAFAAKGDIEAASQCKSECVDMFHQLGNTYQLRRLGYTLTDNPETVGGGGVLSRVVQLISASNSRPSFGYATVPQSIRELREDEESPFCKPSSVTVRDETLVAADTSDSFLEP